MAQCQGVTNSSLFLAEQGKWGVSEKSL